MAASLALLFARSSPDGVLLLDAAGDLPAALGVADDGRLGLADWLASDAPDAAGLARLEVEASPGVRLVPWHGPPSLSLSPDLDANSDNEATPASVKANGPPADPQSTTTGRGSAASTVSNACGAHDRPASRPLPGRVSLVC